MLTISGTCLNVTSEIVTPRDQPPFESVTIHLLTGKSHIHYIRVSKNYPAPLPVEGEQVTVEVMLSTWVQQGGSSVGHRFIALRPVTSVTPAKAA